MLKSSEKTGVNEYTVALSIDGEAFEAAVNKAYNKQKNNIAIQGFRKGKAPRALIERVYGANVFYDEALEIVFPEVYEAAVEEAGIDPVDNPFDFDIKSIGKEGVELVCKVTVKPEFTLEGYKGIEAVRPSTEVTDEDVDAEIELKRKNNAREISIEDRTDAQNGDIAVIDFEGFTDGKAFEGGKGEDYDLELGSGSFIPGFEEQIAGHTVGEEFDINVNFPEDYAEELAGKAAVFKIKLKGLKAKELPALDDEFVKDVSEFDTLDELKADTKKLLTERKEKNAKTTFENTVFDKLSDKVTAEIPQCMIDKTVDNMFSQFKYQVESQGIPFDSYIGYLGMTEESLKETYKERAEKEVKLELALEKVAQLEAIEISDEDVEKEFTDMAEKYKVDVDTVKKAVLPENVKKELASRKATDLVLENAVATAE